LEPEHIIDETVTIPGADIEKVYDDCLVWLKKIIAYRINDSEKFNRILAEHTGLTRFRSSGIPFDYAKHIEIILRQNCENVEVHVFMDQAYPKSPIDRYEKRRIFWKSYVGDLWKHLGVKLGNEEMQYYYPRIYFKEKNPEQDYCNDSVWNLYIICVFLFKPCSFRAIIRIGFPTSFFDFQYPWL